MSTPKREPAPPFDAAQAALVSMRDSLRAAQHGIVAVARAADVVLELRERAARTRDPKEAAKLAAGMSTAFGVLVKGGDTVRDSLKAATEALVLVCDLVQEQQAQQQRGAGH